MTITDIITHATAALGSYSEPTFRRDCARLKIKPLGKLRSVPRQYPDEALGMILADRGVQVPGAATIATAPASLPTLGQLRAAKGKAKR